MARLAELLICFSLIFSSAFSRTLPESSGMNVLDVSSSLQKTASVFSVKSAAAAALQSSENEESADSGDKLSFTLHSRVGVREVSQKDYNSLTLARLGRDSLRVKSLQTRVDLAVNGISLSDLKPLDTQLFRAESIQGPVISGTSQGSGEYFSRVGIGRPTSQVYMVLDTGSDVNWLQCAPCADCYQQADPIFQPASSSTFKPLTCDSEQCRSLDVSECRNGTCLYEVSYGDGSYTVGDFATETITLGGSAAVEKVAIGCGHNNEGLFVGAAGLLGLGGGPLSFSSQIEATSFSYCLVDRDSDASSTLEFDNPIPTDSVTAPLVKNPKLDTFRYVELTGISVSGDLLPISPSSFQLNDNGDGGVIVDSGTAVTRLPTEAYNAVRDAFTKGTKDLPSTDSVALFDTCYAMGTRKSVEVPSVSFHFSNGKELPLPAKNYLIPVDSTGTFCFAFAPTSSSLTIIGNVQQQGIRVTYDVVNSQVAFSPNKC